MSGLMRIVVLSLVFASSRAYGQTSSQPVTAPATPRLSVGVGYQLLHIPDETFPFGLNFDVAAPLTASTTVVGEFGFATDDQTEPGVGGNLKFYNLGAGPRWSMRALPTGRRAIEPFAQILVGAVRTDADLTLNGAAFHDADWAFMIQPGVGVSVPIAPAFGAFGQVDYRRSFFSPSENEFRFLFGVRVQRR
jgi:hypothetical protein